MGERNLEAEYLEAFKEVYGYEPTLERRGVAWLYIHSRAGRSGPHRPSDFPAMIERLGDRAGARHLAVPTDKDKS